MGNLQEKPRRRLRLHPQQLIGLGMIAAIALVVIIAAFNNFGY